MAFRCGQNYTDSKNTLKTSKLGKCIECNKKYESRFSKYMFTNEKKTRVEILQFESKKMRVELKKKYSSRETENADQLCCLSMS